MHPTRFGARGPAARWQVEVRNGRSNLLVMTRGWKAGGIWPR